MLADIYPDVYTAGQVEAAMCVWEYFLNNSETYADWFDGLGTGQMRLSSQAIGIWVDKVFQAYEQNLGEFDRLFDWEFVPAAVELLDLDEVFELTAYAQPHEWPDPFATARKIKERFECST